MKLEEMENFRRTSSARETAVDWYFQISETAPLETVELFQILSAPNNREQEQKSAFQTIKRRSARKNTLIRNCVLRN